MAISRLAPAAVRSRRRSTPDDTPDRLPIRQVMCRLLGEMLPKDSIGWNLALSGMTSLRVRHSFALLPTTAIGGAGDHMLVTIGIEPIGLGIGSPT